MSFIAISWAVKQKTPCGGSKLLLIMLSNYADDKNESYPSLSHLSSICSFSQSSVARYTKKLVETGLIKVRKHGKGMKKHNVYTINMPKKIVANLKTNTNITNENKFTRQKTRNKNFIAG